MLNRRSNLLIEVVDTNTRRPIALEGVVGKVDIHEIGDDMNVPRDGEHHVYVFPLKDSRGEMIIGIADRDSPRKAREAAEKFVAAAAEVGKEGPTEFVSGIFCDQKYRVLRPVLVRVRWEDAPAFRPKLRGWLHSLALAWRLRA